jgi:hypothetical protein
LDPQEAKNMDLYTKERSRKRVKSLPYMKHGKITKTISSGKDIHKK